MSRLAVPIVLLAVVLAGCAQPVLDQDAVVDYLGTDVDARAPGCPFPVGDDAREGIAGATGAQGFAVGPTGVVYVAYPDRLETIGPDWVDRNRTPLDGSAEASRVAAGPDVVAVARRTGPNWTLATFTLALEPVADRSLADVGGLDVDAEGTVHVVTDPDGGAEAVTRYDGDLSVVGRTGLDGIDDAVIDLGICRDRLVVATPDAVHVLGRDGEPVRTDAASDTVRDVGVGHDLLIVAGAGEGGHRLDVRTVGGTDLAHLDNTRGLAYGTFEVANGLVYNLRSGALLARPIADYLTKPS